MTLFPKTRILIQDILCSGYKTTSSESDHTLKSVLVNRQGIVFLSFSMGINPCEILLLPHTIAGLSFCKINPHFWRNQKFEIRSSKKLFFSSIYICHSNAKGVKILDCFVLFWRHFLVYLMCQNKILSFSHPTFWLHSLLL